jgi:hypothetical protein
MAPDCCKGEIKRVAATEGGAVTGETSCAAAALDICGNNLKMFYSQQEGFHHLQGKLGAAEMFPRALTQTHSTSGCVT